MPSPSPGFFALQIWWQTSKGLLQLLPSVSLLQSSCSYAGAGPLDLSPAPRGAFGWAGNVTGRQRDKLASRRERHRCPLPGPPSFCIQKSHYSWPPLLLYYLPLLSSVHSLILLDAALRSFFTKSIGILPLTKPKGPISLNPQSKASREVPGRTWGPSWWAALSLLRNPDFRSDLWTTHYLTAGLKHGLRLTISQGGQYPCCISFSLFSPSFPCNSSATPCNCRRNVIAALCNCCRNNLSCHWLTLFTHQEKLADQSPHLASGTCCICIYNWGRYWGSRYKQWRPRKYGRVKFKVQVTYPKVCFNLRMKQIILYIHGQY